MSWLLLTAAIAHADDDGWEFRGAIGGEFDARPSAVVDVGWRRGDWAIELLTSHLRGTWQPTLGADAGKAWLTVDAEPGTAGMFFEPWEDGAFAEDRVALAAAFGVTGGVQAYLPLGLYAGVEGQSSYWVFFAFPGATTPTLPADRPFHTVDAVVGFWRPWLNVWVRGGIDWTGAAISPHVEGRLETNAPWIVRPKLIVHATWADATDDISATRIGGNNPYSVPLAGAAWAEFWVEDFGAFRTGIEAGRTEAEIHTWMVQAVADVVLFEGRTEVGVSVGGSYDNRGRFVQLAVGYSPTVQHPGGLPLSVWLLGGATWGKGLKPR